MAKSAEMLAIEARWQEKYGRYPHDVRMKIIAEETQAGLKRLKDAGIEPTMTADELMKLTRDY